MDETRRKLIVVLRQFAPWVEDQEESRLMNQEIREIGLDSMSVASMLFELEESFGITFTDDLLTYEMLKTPAGIEAAVRGLLET